MLEKLIIQLVESTELTKEQLTPIAAQSNHQLATFTTQLLASTQISEQALYPVLADYYQIKFIDLASFDISPRFSNRLNEQLARTLQSILLYEENNRYVVGMADPSNLMTVDEINRHLDKPIEIALIQASKLNTTFNLIYRNQEEIEGFVKELSDELEEEKAIDLQSINPMSEDDVPVIKLLTSLFESAIRHNASDIHIEQLKDSLQVRFRINGDLQVQLTENKHIANALIQRLKILANLDIAEKRKPQDGRFSLNMDRVMVDVRMSTAPTQYGESVVLRILNQSSEVISLEEIGMPPALLKKLEPLINAPYGMIIVTGPTGSGKSTTLYGALSTVDAVTRKVVTAEDPIERQLPNVIQTQTNSAIDVDFAALLRSFLRQDPDVIMLGEIRDHETAQIAIRAALTGHLLFSTLHTNDSISAISRLLDLDIAPFLLGSSLLAVLSQRLVKKICHNCHESVEMTPQMQAWLESLAIEDLNIQEMQLMKGKGCTYCNQTGFSSRIGVFELLVIDEELSHAMHNHEEFIKKAKAKLANHLLKHQAVELIKQGTTTIEEAMRVIGG